MARAPIGMTGERFHVCSLPCHTRSRHGTSRRTCSIAPSTASSRLAGTRRRGAATLRCCVAAVVICIGSFLLGLEALERRHRTVWIVLGVLSSARSRSAAPFVRPLAASAASRKHIPRASPSRDPRARSPTTQRRDRRSSMRDERPGRRDRRSSCRASSDSHASTPSTVEPDEYRASSPTRCGRSPRSRAGDRDRAITSVFAFLGLIFLIALAL